MDEVLRCSKGAGASEMLQWCCKGALCGRDGAEVQKRAEVQVQRCRGTAKGCRRDAAEVVQSREQVQRCRRR